MSPRLPRVPGTDDVDVVALAFAVLLLLGLLLSGILAVHMIGGWM